MTNQKLTVIVPVRDVSNYPKLYADLLSATELDVNFLEIAQGQGGIATEDDVLAVEPEMQRLALKAPLDGADAILLYCLTEPGLSAIRRQVSIPVVGLLETCVSFLNGYEAPVEKILVMPRFHPDYPSMIAKCLSQYPHHESIAIHAVNAVSKEATLKSMQDYLLKRFSKKSGVVILTSSYLLPYVEDLRAFATEERLGIDVFSAFEVALRCQSLIHQ